MGKGHLDHNLEKNLAELEKHPALFRRCQEFYLERVINRKTYEDLAKEHGVAVSTAFKYASAYRKVAERYADSPSIQDVIAFCHSEVAQLLKWREEARASQERQMFTKEIRAYQAMINEVTGLVDRKPQVNVNILVGQVVNVISEEFPKALQEFIGQPLTAELADKVMVLAGERIVKRIGGGG